MPPLWERLFFVLFQHIPPADAGVEGGEPTLEQTEPPKDFTADTIKAWLESIKAAPDEDAIHLLIERIDVGAEKNKAAFNMKSTLKTVLHKTGCGGGI